MGVGGRSSFKSMEEVDESDAVYYYDPLPNRSSFHLRHRCKSDNAASAKKIFGAR
jgi:hypothetical protein